MIFSEASVDLRTAGDAQHEVGEDYEERNEEEGDGRACGEVAALNAQREGERGKGLRGVEGAAGGEDVDDGHVRECEDKPEENGDAEDGTHHRDDDLELRAPEAGAVDRCGLGNVLGNGGASGKDDHGGKGNDAPTVNEHDGGDGENWFAKPHGGAERFVKMERDENPRDDAVDGIEQPLPTDGAERNGRDPGKQNQKAYDAAAAKGVFEGDGEDVGADEDDDLRAGGEDKRIANGEAETGALQDAAKILEADVVELGVADTGVAEGVKNGEEEGAGDEEKDVESGRGEHGGAEERALSRGSGFNSGGGYCHETSFEGTRFC